MQTATSIISEKPTSPRTTQGKLPTAATTIDQFVRRFDSVLSKGEVEAANQVLAYCSYQQISDRTFLNAAAEVTELEVFTEPTPAGKMVRYGDKELSGYKLLAQLIFGDCRAINFAKALALFWSQEITRQDLSLVVAKNGTVQQVKLDILTMVADGADFEEVKRFRDSLAKKAEKPNSGPFVEELFTPDILDQIFESPLPTTSDAAADQIRHLAFHSTWRLVMIGRRLTDVHTVLVGEHKFRGWLEEQNFSFSEKSARRYMAMYAFLSTIPRDKVSHLLVGNAGRPLITEGACVALGSASPSAQVVAEVLTRCEAGQRVTKEMVEEELLPQSEVKKASPAAFSLKSVWNTLQSKPSAHPLLKKDDFRDALATCVSIVESTRDQSLHKALVQLLKRLMKDPKLKS